jgi:hypothetical protein
MIDTVRDLARLFASDSVTVEAFVRRLGPIVADEGIGVSLDLRSSDPRFSHVELSRDVETGVPSMLLLELAPAAQLSVADFARAFGAYKESGPVHIDSTPTLIFQGVAKDAATATLIVHAAERTAPLDRATVVRIFLIREPRLD